MRRLPLFLFALLLTLGGCDSDGDNDDGGGDGGSANCEQSGAGLFTATIGGARFCPSIVGADVSAGRIFVVGRGTYADTPGAVLVITAPSTAGSYPLGSSGSVYASLRVEADGVFYDSDGERATGTITVSEITRDSTGTLLMEGAFSLELDELDESTETYTGETLTITDGEFDVRDTGL